LPISQSRRTLEAIDEAAIALPVAHRLLPTFTRWHLTVPAVARGSLEAPVGRVDAQVDGMSHDDGLRIRGHIILALAWASSYHLSQGSSYHQKGVT
jgi:hypothetical protein